jgi:hypothetical protein
VERARREENKGEEKMKIIPAKRIKLPTGKWVTVVPQQARYTPEEAMLLAKFARQQPKLVKVRNRQEAVDFLRKAAKKGVHYGVVGATTAGSLVFKGAVESARFGLGAAKTGFGLLQQEFATRQLERQAKAERAIARARARR